MDWKQRLNIAVCIFVITLCSLFVVGWVANVTGVASTDLQVLIQALNAIQKILEVLLGG